MANPPKRMDLTQGPITRTLFMFSLPVLGSSALQSLNGSVNAMWVGRLLGEEALTATTNATLLLIFLLGAVFGVGMAATILVGQAVGAKDLTQMRRVVGASVTFFMVLALVTAGIGIWLSEPILALMNTPADVRPLAIEYLRVLFLSLPFLYMAALLIMVQRGVGDARTPFYFTALAVVLDIVFNPLLILGVGPLPRMGIAGAAMATLVSQAISMAAMLIYLYASKSDIALRGADLRYLKPDPEIVRTLILKGLPMGLQMAVVSISALVMMAMINGYGASTAAAYGVAFQLWVYLQMPAMAIGAGVSSFAAQNVGAQRWDRVDATARAGITINVALTGALVVALYLLDPFIVPAFLPGEPEAIAVAERINTIGAWAFVAFGVTFVLFGVVRATGAVTPPLLILIVSLFGVRIGFANAFQPLLGADAIWWSFPVSMMTSMLLAMAYYRWGGWRGSRMAPPRAAPDDGAPGDEKSPQQV